jgi:predicted metal-dependent peptidase
MTMVMPHIHEKAPTREPSESEVRALLKRLSACRTKLLAVVPFFGHLCLNLTPRIARPQDRVDTAAVSLDGTLILNYDFCAKLTDSQLCGLLCHEVMHPALLCWQRQGTRLAIVTDEKGGGKFSLWNLAHDLSFNPEILELAERSEAKGQVELPADGAIDPKMKGMAAEEIYDALLKKAKKGKGGAGSIQLPGNGKHGIGDDMRSDLSDSEEGQKAADGNSASQRKLEEDWKVNVVAAAQVQEKEKGKGTLPAGLQKIVDDLTDPKVDWKDVLLMKFGVSDIVILWDTSGSMNGRETEILSEVQGICEDLGLALRVICIDTAIHSDVSDIQDALDVIPHIKGGGGSNFCPAFDLLDKEQYDGVVVSFTDGYIDVPETKPHLLKAVLWVIGEHDTDPTGGKWGEVLHMNDEAMGR